MRLDSFLAATEKLTYTEAAGVWTVAEKNMASTAPQPAPTKLHHTVGSTSVPVSRPSIASETPANPPSSAVPTSPTKRSPRMITLQ